MTKVRTRTPDHESPPNLTDSTHDDVQSRWVWTDHNPREARIFIDLLTVGDTLRINDRSRFLTVTEKHYHTDPHRCHLILTGNGTTYRLGYDRIGATGPLTFTRLSDNRNLECTHLNCRNRNPFNIPEYDNLLSEEIEAVPPIGSNTYRERELHVEGETMQAIVTCLRIQVEFSRRKLDLTAPEFDRQYRAMLALLHACTELKQGHNTDGITFYGAEKGWVGAALDEVVDHGRLNVPQQFRNTCRSIRQTLSNY